ncbi:MAG: DUF4176 domain-containing protein [Eubacterium sp.]|nr:DUF4176 domain-containing protein [Eubacterium sp.]
MLDESAQKRYDNKEDVKVRIEKGMFFLKKGIAVFLLLFSMTGALLGCAKQPENNIVINSLELTVEQSNELLETIDWLPLGTVVSVDDSGQKIMIVGRNQRDAYNPNVSYEYSAVFYPQGLMNPEENMLLNLNQVKQIHYLGYSDNQNKQFEEFLNDYVKENNISFDN